MTKHEKLKEVADLIWYENDDINFEHSFWIVRKTPWEIWFRILNVREIIFTQEFMDLFFKKIDFPDSFERMELLRNLNNPVDYLYELISE